MSKKNHHEHETHPPVAEEPTPVLTPVVEPPAELSNLPRIQRMMKLPR